MTSLKTKFKREVLLMLDAKKKKKEKEKEKAIWVGILINRMSDVFNILWETSSRMKSLS